MSGSRSRRYGALVASAGLVLAADLAGLVAVPGSAGHKVVSSGTSVAAGSLYSPPSSLYSPAPPTTVAVPTTAAAATSGGGFTYIPAGGKAVADSASTAGTYHPPAAPATTASTTTSTTAAPVDVCASEACINVDGTRPYSAVQLAGAGINNSVAAGSNDDLADLKALGTTMYRSSPGINSNGTYDWSSWDVAEAAGAHTTLILSNLWDEHNSSGGRLTPWSNWPAYETWVRQTVRTILASGRRVDYWDIYNEPGWHDYYDAADFATETPQDLLQQFLVTYQAIMAVDPGANVVGPSIGLFALSPLPPNPLTHEPDLATFLQFASANNLRLAAVAWHDNSKTPAQIVADANATWRLIHSLPGIGNPTMFIDEYGTEYDQVVPGYDVSILSALAQAGITSADRSCWGLNCTWPTLDALLGADGSSTTADYYVRSFYAGMTGQWVVDSSSTPTVAALAALDSTARRMSVLVGRYTLTSGNQPMPSGAPPQTIAMQFHVPWSGSAPAVSVERVAYAVGTSGGPVAVAPSGFSARSDGAGGQIVTLVLPAVTDGDAYTITLDAS